MSKTQLARVLSQVPRRYLLPPLPDGLPPGETDAGTAVALVLERVRATLAHGGTPEAPLKASFLDALARLIREAMRGHGDDSAPGDPVPGDPVFQAMVLRHRMPCVREYASLAAHAERDRREVRALVNGVAHPGKQARRSPGPVHDVLAQLHALAGASRWARLRQAARHALETPGIAGEAAIESALASLAASPALARLDLLDTLATDGDVRRYQALWDLNGPRSGSPAAVARGSASQRRGAEVEAQAASAIVALAQRLERDEAGDEAGQGGQTAYRVVTSMRVPASLSASADRAKTEWDVVLLRRNAVRPQRDAAFGIAEDPWDVCLLVEAKASLDAATTDLQRLLRGLRLLASADASLVYHFQTRDGNVPISGASLRAPCTDDAALRASVLYCCDAAQEAQTRLLGAASRMQLLSAPASLAFAARCAEDPRTGVDMLEPVWQALLATPAWTPVLHQYTTLRQVRELLVHVDDLSTTVASTA
ncbi:hypothetical protein CAL12_11170 [Bordetella genomosp. 8]|uniref:3-deoxy-D-arabino-heptulosonate 7-phosphate synthase n=1 Tax=Bordetella genomosp. 8 TaxID=1416806 RepID=A0A1W6YJS0_9BORD|nr:hypothetical protein [Bordetella genomosp. 8]ARP81345.1 hypothetical protein CAL12_11170 [Bordetella genomosp. 8]